MVSTLDIPEIVANIPKLFDKLGASNKYQQEFFGETAFTDARKFAEGMRKQCDEFVTVEQRNSRVIMIIND